MQINLYGSTATTEATLQTSRTQSAATNGAITAEDKTTLSSGTDGVAALTSLAVQADPARTAKVEALRQAVSSGGYQVDVSQLADAMVKSNV